MDQTKITIYFIAAAITLTALAFVLKPSRITPDAFLDMGEEFFPEFTDPNSATTLEVITFDETTGSTKAFKVSFASNRWTIPSHHGYPADGKERLAKTAAGVIDIKKDDFRTDNVSEHELCKVLDPLDESASINGRGQRVTIKGQGDEILADIIIGDFIEGHQNMRFVRIPDQKRVYAARVDIDLSTDFADWIETDLMNVSQNRIEKVNIKNYSINERTGSVDNRDNTQLYKKDDSWTARKLSSGKALDTLKMKELLVALDFLSIVGVRKKPEGLSASLKKDGAQSMSNSDVRSLQSKGYFITRDKQLLSNEGELVFTTSDAVQYTLRFGEVVYGSGLAVTSGQGNSGNKEASGENRYLFITTSFDQSFIPKPKSVRDSSFIGVADSLLTTSQREEKEVWRNYRVWENRIANGKKLSQEMNARFAEWYYVISSASYDKIHLSRKDLIS